MGCYCCGCDEEYEKTRQGLSSGIITEEANKILTAAKAMEVKLQELTLQPLRTYDVPVWNSGNISSYLSAIADVKQRRAREKRPPVLKRMLKPHFEAAALQAEAFYSAQDEPLQRPDPNWWVVIGILAVNTEALYDLKKEEEQLETRFRLHEHTTETIKKELQNTGSLKSPESAAVDKDSRAKMDKLAADLAKLEPFSSECARLLRDFYVDVDESLIIEAERKEAELKEAKHKAPEPKEVAEPKETDPFMPAKSQKKPEAK